MALIAISFTVEIITLIVALYFGFDSGLIRKFSAFGLCSFGITLVNTPQVFISDLTSSPQIVTVNFPGNIQNVMTVMFALVALTIVASAFLDIRKMSKETNKEDVVEYIV